MAQQRAADAAPARLRRGVHRLDLGVRRVQFLERRDAEDRVAVPVTDERHLGVKQPVHVEGEAVFRRRLRQGEVQVPLQQRPHLGPARVVGGDRGFGCGSHPGRLATGGFRSVTSPAETAVGNGLITVHAAAIRVAGGSEEGALTEQPHQPGRDIMPPSDQPYLEQSPVNESPSTQQLDMPASARARTSRRNILRGIAGVGAVGVAAAVGAGAVAEFDRPSAAQAATLKPASKPVVMAPMAPSAMAGPLVVYISDTTTGKFDVYGDTGATQVNNPALVNQLLDNLKLQWS
jgi:hypothetical protein